MSIAGNEKQEHEVGKNGILPLRRDKIDLAVLRAKVSRCKETRFWQAVCAADEWTASRNFASVLAEPRARLPKYSLTPGFARRKSRLRAGEGKIMAEEINPVGTVAAVEATTPADVPVPKKRGPRAKKVALDATTAEASIAPAAKRGRKRKEAPVEAKAANQAAPTVKTRAKAAIKGSGKGPASKPSAGSTGAVLDEIADLLQLEEENARLRKALADKLRAENADLKKRLGLN
nr:hypothetical protein [Ensifer sp. PDNC004]